MIKYAPVVRWLPRAGVEWLIATPIVIGACVALAHWAPDAVDRWLARGDRWLTAPPPREFSARIALVVLTLSLIACWYCFGGHAIAGDEMSQRFQAGLLLQGRFSAVAEPHMEFFSGVEALARDGRWYSQFPVGGPLLLAVGALFNAPWLVNPVLAALSAVLFYRFARYVVAERTARGAALLFALSPGIVFMSATQMNHTGTLAMVLLALASLGVWTTAVDRERLALGAAGVGFGVAAAATIRPYDAVLVAIPVALFQLAALRGSPGRWRSFAWQIAAGAVPLALLFVANAHTTGHPLLFGYDAFNSAAHRPGFHRDPQGIDFTPTIGIHHISAYLLRANFTLLAGPLPALPLVVLALLLIKPATRWDLLVAGIVVSICVGYACYWSESFILGMPRFLYCIFPLLLLLIARVPRLWADRMPSPTGRRALQLMLPLSVAIAWALPAPAAMYIGAQRYAGYLREPERQITADIDAGIRDAGLTDALIFVHDSWHGRLAARLRALDAPALAAEEMAMRLDACALQRALDAEDDLPAPVGMTRVQRVVREALAAGDAQPVMSMEYSMRIALVGGRIPPECLPQLRADEQGVSPLEPFLLHEQFGRDGALNGPVVFARDFGVRNSLLLGRFGDRTWYRYRPRTGPDDHEPIFVPYFRAR